MNKYYKYSMKKLKETNESMFGCFGLIDNVLL